jgi:hypothetical protein
VAGRPRTSICITLGTPALGILAALVLTVGTVAPAAARLNEAVPAEYRGLIEQAAEDCSGLPAEVLAAQLQEESDFNPAAISPAGAMGIAQFMPRTWVDWGRDTDGNGTASPFDPVDAIDAQGRLMCELLRRSETSGLAGDPVELALAGYNAGWNAVLRYGGIPPYAETEDYVASITARAAEFRAAQSGGSFVDADSFGTLPRANPHTVAEALAYADAATAGTHEWYRRCLSFVAHAYGWNHSGTLYAIDHYRVVMPPSMRHDGDRNPPPGALLFWDTGGRAGHVALYLGGGLIASNDIVQAGAISIVPATEIERKWGATYVGWAPPYFPRAG